MRKLLFALIITLLPALVQAQSIYLDFTGQIGNNDRWLYFDYQKVYNEVARVNKYMPIFSEPNSLIHTDPTGPFKMMSLKTQIWLRSNVIYLMLKYNMPIAYTSKYPEDAMSHDCTNILIDQLNHNFLWTNEDLSHIPLQIVWFHPGKGFLEGNEVPEVGDGFIVPIEAAIVYHLYR